MNTSFGTSLAIKRLNMQLDTHIPDITKDKRLCPMLNEPFDDCYCLKMSSQDIERTVFLCSTNYRLCDIYKSGKGNGHGKRKSPGTALH